MDPTLLEPVRRIPTDAGRPVDDSVALCLSGGGYRAMLFHVGVLRRLGDAGWLSRLDRISSVSGGSIVAAVLALAWDELDLGADGGSDRFVERVEEPVRRLARHTIDVPSVATGIALPGVSISERLAAAYRERLFGGATLQELPEEPAFVINATNVGSGELLRFSRRYLADWRVGRINQPDVEVATAVASSSAFPPVLSPARIRLGDADWITEEGNDLDAPENRDEIVLTDGGVYDNLGLETAWKRCRTVLVSDAGGRMASDPDPEGDWARHTIRVLKVIDNQVRALRKRQVIEGFKRGDRTGLYLGIRSHVEDYGLADPLPHDPVEAQRLAEIPTRLAGLDARDQEGLINWGYVICDTALRRHLDPGEARPQAVPHPRSW
jgi:NTE family protein